MKKRTMIAIIGMVLLVFGTAQAGVTGPTGHLKPSLIYGAMIDEYVHKCEVKASLLDSGSLNIRKDAMRATVKGAYLKSNRTKMIRHLMEINAPLNPDRIAFHLNQKFAKSVQPEDVYAVLLKANAK